MNNVFDQNDNSKNLILAKYNRKSKLCNIPCYDRISSFESIDSTDSVNTGPLVDFVPTVDNMYKTYCSVVYSALFGEILTPVPIRTVYFVVPISCRNLVEYYTRRCADRSNILATYHSEWRDQGSDDYLVPLPLSEDHMMRVTDYVGVHDECVYILLMDYDTHRSLLIELSPMVIEPQSGTYTNISNKLMRKLFRKNIGSVMKVVKSKSNGINEQNIDSLRQDSIYSHFYSFTVPQRAFDLLYKAFVYWSPGGYNVTVKSDIVIPFGYYMDYPFALKAVLDFRTLKELVYGKTRLCFYGLCDDKVIRHMTIDFGMYCKKMILAKSMYPIIAQGGNEDDDYNNAFADTFRRASEFANTKGSDALPNSPPKIRMPQEFSEFSSKTLNGVNLTLKEKFINRWSFTGPFHLPRRQKIKITTTSDDIHSEGVLKEVFMSFYDIISGIFSKFAIPLEVRHRVPILDDIYNYIREKFPQIEEWLIPIIISICLLGFIHQYPAFRAPITFLLVGYVSWVVTKKGWNTPTVIAACTAMINLALSVKDDTERIEKTDELILKTLLSKYNCKNLEEMRSKVGSIVLDNNDLEMFAANNIEAQSSSDYWSRLELVAKTVVSCCWINWSFTKDLTNGLDKSSSFWKCIGGFGKVYGGITSFAKLMFELIQSMMEYVCGRFGMLDPFSEHLGIDPLEKLYERWSVYDQYRWDPQTITTPIAIEIQNLYNDIKGAYSRLPMSKSYDTYRRNYYTLIKLMEPTMMRIGKLNLNADGLRFEPLGILVGGGSGNGKSSLAVPLCQRVIAKHISKDKLAAFLRAPNSEIYHYNPEQEHSTYAGQFATAVDDFLQPASGSEAAQKESMSAIRMINTAPYNQNCAALEDKGRFWFESRIWFGTTNKRHFNDNLKDIIKPDALARRFRVALMMGPRKEYCSEETKDLPIYDRKFRWGVLADSEDYDPELWSFIKWDFNKGIQVDPHELTMEEVIDIISSEFDSLHANSLKRMRFASDMRRKGLSERDDNEDIFMDSIDDEDVFKMLGDRNLTVSHQFHKIKMFVERRKIECALALATVTALIAMTYHFLKKDKDDNICQSGILSRKPKDPQKTAPRRLPQLKPITIQAQANINSQLQDVVDSVRVKNQYHVSIGSVNYGMVTFLKGRIFLAPYHFCLAWLTSFEKGNKRPLRFSPVGAPQGGFECNIDDILMKGLSGPEDADTFRDIAICTLPDTVCHLHRSILKFLPTELERTKFLSDKQQSAMLALYRLDKNMLISTIANRARDITYSSMEGNIFCADVYGYSIETNVGDCGALLWSDSMRMGRPIILGMHVAGRKFGNGYAVDITSDLLLSTLAMCVGNGDLVPEPVVEAHMGPQFSVIGTVKENLGKNTSHQFKLSKLGRMSDPIWSRGPREKLSLLHSVGPLDPDMISREKYSKFANVVDRDLLDLITGRYMKDIFSVKYEIPPVARVLTYEEAVAGIPCSDFHGVPRSTSPGYPWIVQRGKHPGKTYWMGKELEYDFTSVAAIELREHVDKMEKLVRNSIRPEFCYVDNLKDETLPAEKVDKGKTRNFSASPQDYLILCRKYFGAFVSWFKENRIGNMSAYGVNPFNTAEWSHIVAHLGAKGARKGQYVFGDHSGYDGALKQQFQYLGLRIINKFYRLYGENWTVEDEVARTILFEDIVNSIHLYISPSGVIKYQWIGSIPSGTFLTTILNTICNIIVLTYGICKATDFAMETYSDKMNVVDFVWKNLTMIVFGDDNGWAITQLLAEHLNLSAVTEQLALIGFTYTDEKKLPISGYRKLEECQFLKRGFRRVPEGYVAPLDLDAILETPLWQKIGVRKEDYARVCEDVLKELSLHGKGVYCEYAPEFIETVHKLEDIYLEDNYDMYYQKSLNSEWEYAKM
jgi:hypothetical protein